MKCEEARALLVNSPTAEAHSHMDTCPDCQMWLMWSSSNQNVILSAETEGEIVRVLTTDLKPTRAIRPKQLTSAFLFLGSTGVILVGFIALGIRGWLASGMALRSYLGATITLGLGMGAYLIPRLFIPGELLKINPPLAITAITVAVVLPTFFRPLGMYPGFTRAALACVSIGLVIAAAAAWVAYRVLRRGFVVSRAWTYAMIGNFCGLSGFAVLFIFCPHSDLAHHLLGHAGMLLVSMCLGLWFVAISRRMVARDD